MESHCCSHIQSIEAAMMWWILGLSLVNQGSQVRSPASPETLPVEPSGAHKIHTQTINPPGPVLPCEMV